VGLLGQVLGGLAGGAGGGSSPVQGVLTGMLGEDQVRSMASQAGMAPIDFLSQLSRHLPNAVDGTTPDGRLPDEGTVSV